MITDRQQEIIKIVKQHREMKWEQIYCHFYGEAQWRNGYASKKMKLDIELLIDRGYLAVREEKHKGSRGRPAKILTLRK